MHKRISSNNIMGDEAFDEKLLTEKLSKLNSSQQSIESLSKWCVSHRKKAKQVVETWETLFGSALKEQRVSFLYLANDILQNSRRKGSEFVNEFWKVLPAALKGIHYSGDENCRKVASRLVDIWEERKVFGSRGQNLKQGVLGNNSSPGKNPSLVNNVKSSNLIKIAKRDSNFLRIKLAVGGLPEKILTAFQSVHDEIVNEEGSMDKCRSAVSAIREIEKNVSTVSSKGNILGSDVVDNILKEENVLQQCVSELENSEAIRLALVSQLREALEDQESKLELIRSEIHVARGEIEQAANMRLTISSTSSAPQTIVNQRMIEPTFPPALPTSNLSTVPPTNPLTSFVNVTSEEESKKAAAAAVAAKLAASTSSAQMLTSVLSSLVAEEAASISSALKRQKLEKPMEGSTSAYFSITQQATSSFPPVQPHGSQSVGPVPLQAPFLPPPPLLAPPASSPANQFPQTSMMGMPYGYGPGSVPPPPLSSTGSMSFARTVPPHQQGQQQTQTHTQPQQQLHQASGGYYRPVGMGFYGQSHQPSTPPIHRQ